MLNYVSYLKSPELVVSVQEFFGIKYLKNKISNHSNDIKTRDKNLVKLKPSDQINGVHKVNVHRNSNDAIPSNDESSNSSENDLRNVESSMQAYQITNKFWYYLFIIGTELGDEIFYACFIPFWFWNIDGAVGRRMVFVWSIIMYIGQGLKDIIRWPRPGHPAYRLQKKWALEYGMPSTHAMVAVAIPFSVLIYTLDRYQYSAIIGLIAAISWCLLISISRIYLGMHSVLDVIIGLLLTTLLLFPLIPMVDELDNWILTYQYSPLIILVVSILMIVIYPKADRWTPTRGDTTLCLSVCAGIQIGAWINFQAGDMTSPLTPPPYAVIWPSHQMLGLILLRTILGLCCIVATRAICKSISYAFVCALLGEDKNQLKNSEDTLDNKSKMFVELSYKYFTYGMIGFNTQYLLPNVFKLLGIGRPDFYTEI